MKNIRRTITSAFAWLLCGAMLMGSMPMALPVRAQEAPCTQTAHVHVEDCYVQVTVETQERMICTVDADVIIHQHTDCCYDEAGELRCALEEKEVHTHGEDCLDEEQNLICQKEVLEPHTHGADCYDAEGALACEKAQVVEHVHTEECFTAETVPVDTESLTCSITDETHAHGKLCYGTWVLECDLPEHTHTDACGIATSPNQSTESSTEATVGQILSESRGTVPEQSEAGKINGGYPLDGDFAYISNLSVSSQDGNYPLDTDDARGNDSSFDNGILRTYDTATYTIKFQTHLCEKLDANFIGYSEGRLHYEFVLPFSETEARFEADEMGWMEAYPGGAHTLTTETRNGKTIQVLRGSFVLGGEAENNPSAIGEGERTLKAVVRALTLPDGTTLQPYFTLWLEYNKDFNGEEIRYTTGENPVHTGLMTQLDGGAGEPEGETHFHTPQTCAGEAITVTAAPRYNISLITTQTNVNSSRGSYDFSAAGNEKAPNFGCGVVDGRLYGFGITIELWGGETAKNEEGKDVSKGLLGVELPAGDITLTIALETLVNRYDGQGFVSVTDTYRPMVWSGGENENTPLVAADRTEGQQRDPDWDTERDVDTDIKDIYSVPINWRLRKHQNIWEKGHCYDGGNWSVGVDDTNQDGDGVNLNEVTVTVSGYQISFSQMPFSSLRETSNRYYDPNVVGNDFWKIEHGVFSAGELWVVQPYTYTAADGEAVDLRETCAEGTTLLRAWITGGSIGGDRFENPYYTDADFLNREPTAANMNYSDDKAQYTDPFSKRGDIVVRALYLKPGGNNNSQPLSANCKDNQNDWAIAGQKVTVEAEYYQVNKEDGNRIAGMDLLLKFDDAFFEPTGYRKVELKPFNEPILWAAKPDGSGWDHGDFKPDEEGYDREQREATPEDLIYFTSLEELKARGYTCVGALMQRRSIIGEGMNYYHMILDGYVKEDALQGYTYLLTYDCRCWSLETLHNFVQGKEVLPEGISPYDKGYDDTYNAYAAKYLPRWDTQTAEAAARADYQMISYGDYLDPCFIRTWERTTNSYGDPNKDSNGNVIPSVFQTTVKTVYQDGFPVMGSGAPDYIDACLVVPYTVNIDKTTAQTNSNGSYKSSYEVGLNQEFVDYKLTPTATRVLGGSSSDAGAEKIITVEIMDILPLGMTLMDDKIYWTGQGENQAFSYTQHPAWREPGEITGGIAPNEREKDTDPWYEVNYVLLEEAPYAGRWAIYITLHNVVLTAGENTSFGTFYYTCRIRNDIPDGTRLENSARIWTDDDIRYQTAENGNLASFSIQVLKNSATTLSKGPDDPYVEWYDPIGFTMNVSNDSGNAMNNVLIADSMPVDGVDGSDFTGALVVTELTATLSKGNSRLKVGEYLSFYYTTSTDFAGVKDGEKLRVENLTAGDLTDGTVWTKLEPMDAANTQLTYRLPEGQEAGQITAIVACGSIPAGYTLNLHTTVKLPQGQADDHLVNYLSMNNGLYSSAYVRVVSRAISGKTWYDGERQDDEDVDHLFGEGDELLDGVTVELLQKNSAGEYVSYYYQDTVDSENPIPVVIQTGQKVSVRDSTSVETHETGEYQFRDLPPGDFEVRFSGNDDVRIYAFTACDQNMGDDTADSDGVPVYDTQLGNGLKHTVITNIVMPEADSNEMTGAFGKYESQNNDSGFYLTRYVLPLTGGMGTAVYYILGAVLTLPALAGLRRRKSTKQIGKSSN